MVYAQHTHSVPSLTQRKHVGKNLLKSKISSFQTAQVLVQPITDFCAESGWGVSLGGGGLRFGSRGIENLPDRSCLRAPFRLRRWHQTVQALAYQIGARFFPQLRLLAHQVIRVLIVLRADELVDLFAWRQIGHAFHRVRLRQDAGVLDGALNFQMA
jgi:hypothetical protein